MLNKIKKNFSGFEQQLFVSSFYCYLKYDKINEFIVDLDDIWKWLGFNQKHDAKRLLEKHFIIDKDYQPAQECSGAVLMTENNIKKNGGQNIKKIFMTIKCFKILCLKAQTSKAYEIHNYYINLEEILQQTIEEESQELREQLLEIKYINEQEKQKAVEQAIIFQFPLNTECIYFGTIDNTNESNETLIKFGHTNDLATRILDHRKKYDNFILVQAFRVQNKVEIENLIKTYPKIKKQIRSIEINGKNKTEIIAYDAIYFTIDKLSKYIKDIIHSKTYSIDNFNKLLKQNEDLIKENESLNHQLHEQNKIIITQTLEINEAREKLEQQKQTINLFENENKIIYQNPLLNEDEQTNNFNNFIDTMCIVRLDVEESSTNMEGAYRIWNKVKPRKDTFHKFKSYLDTRFKPGRLSIQNKNQVVNGYIGVKLISIDYKKKYIDNDVETFLFQVCKFSPNGKILNTTLLSEFQRWKKIINKTLDDDDLKNIKTYLNSCEYVIKSTVWTDKGSNEGYYGILLKADEYKHKNTSSTGKKVKKIDFKTSQVLCLWDSIAKAAEDENISPAKMSRSIKNNVIFNNDYFYNLFSSPSL